MLRMKTRALLGIVVLAVTLGGVLLVAGPSAREVRAFLRDPQTFVDRVGADRAALLVVGAALWALAAWLLLTLTLTVLAGLPALPGVARRLLEPLAAAVTPRVVRTVVIAAIGVGVAAGPAYAVPAASVAQQPSSSAYRADVPVDWPTVAVVTPATSTATDVVVARGDCLWSIVLARLGPTATDTQVAVEVGRWYELNRPTIGADPDLIRPGMVLHPPSAA